MTNQNLPKLPTDLDNGLGDWSILTMYRGSIAHNMYVPNTDPNSVDDVDIMSVCVPPIDYYFGLHQYGSRGTKEIMRDKWDIVIYEALKFIGMLSNGNPNVITMLWLEPQHYLKISKAGMHILEQRDLFACKHLHRSFAGYAYGQAKRMRSPNSQGYMGTKRKELFKKYGYDIKNAAHLIRLLRMCCEFLDSGRLQVYRTTDAQELLDIKTGHWTLQHVEDEAKRLFDLAEEKYAVSKLPEKPDMDKVNQLCCNVMEEHHNVVYKCPFDPKHLSGAPIGMFHCPLCGEMVIAGMDHP